MASRTLRRRPRHDDIDGMENDCLDASSYSLKEPLLGNSYNKDDEPDDWVDKKENLHWSFLFTQLIAQWVQWFGTVLVGSGLLLGRLASFPFTIQHDQKSLTYLSPLMEERLSKMRERLQVSYDSCCMAHQDALRELWMLSYPNREIPPLKSELWKEMGWQGCDPSTDFRGGGFISLENLIFFAKNYPVAFQRLLLKQEGNRSVWEYPFAVAGINISFMLAQMLELQAGWPTTSAGMRFLELLGQDETAFDQLYCVAFALMDAQWLARRASYMEFNDVMKSTRTQLERELVLEDVSSVRDLPAYNMLNS